MPDLLLRQLHYHCLLLVRTPRALVGGVVLPILLLALRDDGSPHLVAGLAVFGVASTAYVTHTSALVAAREAGVLKRWRALPLPRWCYFAGRAGATILVATAGGLVTLLAGASLVHARFDPAVLPSLALGAAAWACLGTAVSRAIPSADAAWPLLGLTSLPVLLMSGAFGAHAAAWTHYLPAQPMTSSLTLQGAAVELAWALGALAVAVRTFRWE